jgi:hypothetical protein
MRRLLIAGLTLIACASVPSFANDDSEMYPLASALTKLAAAVEATVFETPGDQTEGPVLLATATRDNPQLLAPFARYTLHAKRDGGHAFVLVCSPDGLTALLEDAGCSAKLDAHHWKAVPQRPCAFTLTAARACAVPRAP